MTKSDITHDDRTQKLGEEKNLAAFTIDRISLLAALLLLWSFLVAPFFVIPQRFAVFGMDLLHGHSWIGGSNLPQRGLASIDRIIGQMRGGELGLLLAAGILGLFCAILAVLFPRWSQRISIGILCAGWLGLAYYVSFAPDLLLNGSVLLFIVGSVLIIMNLERGEIELTEGILRRSLRVLGLNLLVYSLLLPIIWRPNERYEVRQARLWTTGTIVIAILCLPLYFLMNSIQIDSNVTTIGVGYYLGLLVSLLFIVQALVSRVTGKEAADVGEPLLKKALRRVRRDRLTISALFVIAIIFVISIHTSFITERLMGVTYFTSSPQTAFQPIVSFCGNSPGFNDQGLINEQPCREEHPDWNRHLLGTDELGRDHLARLLYAGQISLTIGISSAFLSFTIGISLGVYTGYYGGIVDDVVNWVIITLNSIPGLLLLILIAALFKPSALVLIGVLAFLSWTGTTRLVRGSTLSLREQEYVLSARASGASDLRIMFLHIVPNLLSIVIVTLTISIGGFILVEAALSFLNYGIPPETPTWGNMLTNAINFFRNKIDLATIPGVMITVTVLCLYLIGDGLRDAFDPTSRD